MIWYNRTERKMIKSRKGKHLGIVHGDGKVNGKPVDVKAIRKDNRFRIQENTLNYLKRNNGSYIFVDRTGKSKKISAKRVSKMLPKGKFYKDRSYSHKFLLKKQVFRA